MRLKIIFLLFLFTGISYSQVKLKGGVTRNKEDDNITRDSSQLFNKRRKNVAKNKDVRIDQYLIISKEFDTTFVDTTLSIQKEYKFNYLRKDDFDLLPFQNIGQTYNTLSYNFSGDNLLPSFVARAKHFNFKEEDDILYYQVPTPLTELMFKTAFEQGQLLESFFTVNTSKQFNFSIGYKGLRSLGKYQHTLSSTGNFSFTTNYQTKNKRYKMRGHIVMQDTYNDENGGISDTDLEQFENGNPEFIDRSVFDPFFENADNELRGKRFYIEHWYNLVQKKDSLDKSQLSIGNKTIFNDKYYQFRQGTNNDEYFGNAFNNDIDDKVKLEDFNFQGNVTYNHDDLGRIIGFVSYRNINYGYNNIVILEGNTITNRIKDNIIAAGGEYSNQIGKFLIQGKIGINIAGDFEGNYLNGIASYNLNDKNKLNVGVNLNSKLPNYNYLLYQSDYINYNWQNNFKNVQTKQLNAELISSYGTINFDLTTINNYTYFSKNTDGQVKPFQTDQSINYLRLKFNNEIKFGKFALNNTLRYQKVLDGDGILNVPEFSVRNTVYYSNHFFNKKALFLQTGITFNYFTSYNMNAYDPLLGEFYVQNTREFGSFPRLDFFVNAKVRQTRIFLKAEHFNSSLTGYNFYSAPNYPYRDFVVRFGIVWNFFL